MNKIKLLISLIIALSLFFILSSCSQSHKTYSLFCGGNLVTNQITSFDRYEGSVQLRTLDGSKGIFWLSNCALFENKGL